MFLDNRLRLVGGSQVTDTKDGYEIEEPNFSLFFENETWIGTIQDMTVPEDKRLSHKSAKLSDVVQFISDEYLKWGKETRMG